ncbi:MAG: hypothetical protein HQK83_01550 [Fibrobacteria bacterium]|nr:hypothetical protein [Fibrobacteria bacterium]
MLIDTPMKKKWFTVLCVRRIIFLFSLLFWLNNCAIHKGTVETNLQSNYDNCKSFVVKNAIIPDSVSKVKTIKFRSIENKCHTELGIQQFAIKTLCDNNWAFGNMYNIEKPNILYGPCYYADIDVYKDSVSFMISNTPVKKLDTLHNKGLEIDLNISLGKVISGNQGNTGLDTDPSVNKTNMGVMFKYLLNPFGLELGGDLYTIASASTDDDGSKDLYTGYVLRAGLIYTLWAGYYLTTTRKIDIALGPNYANLKFHQDYNEANISGWANGYGYYVRSTFQVITVYHVVAGLGVIYEYEGQKFSQEANKHDAKKLQLTLFAGYKF